MKKSIATLLFAAFFAIAASQDASAQNSQNPILGPDWINNWLIPYGGHDANVDGVVDGQDIVDAYFHQLSGPFLTHPGSTTEAADISSVLQECEDRINSTVFFMFNPANIPGAAPPFFGGPPPIEDAETVDDFVFRNQTMFTNPADPYDVNASGSVTPFDVLVLSQYYFARGDHDVTDINLIAQQTSDHPYFIPFFGTSYPSPLLWFSRAFVRNYTQFSNPTSPDYVSPPLFPDVNGDGQVTASDINELNNNLPPSP